jgi:hypothetical protein
MLGITSDNVWKESCMIRKAKIVCLSVLMAAAFVSCTPGIRLDTQGAQDPEVAGTYRVIFFGCNFNNDLETIAFLDREDDQYTFEPFAPDFKYLVRKEVAAVEALAEAKEFVNCNVAYRGARLRKIISPDNVVLGYEVRPLYDPLTYGAAELLSIGYKLNGDKVVVEIRLDRSVEMRLRDSGRYERK